MDPDGFPNQRLSLAYGPAADRSLIIAQDSSPSDPDESTHRFPLLRISPEPVAVKSHSNHLDRQHEPQRGPHWLSGAHEALRWRVYLRVLWPFS